MLEQASLALPCVVQFTNAGTGATGLTVTCTVYKWGGSSWSTVVSSQSASEVGEGFYSYQLPSNNNDGEGLYLFVFTTSGTADLKKIGAGWAVNKAGVEHLDADVTSRLAPTVAARTLDVSATGEAGVDWANVGSPSTTVGLSGTTVKTATDVEADTQDIQSRLPAALVSGRIDASVGAYPGNTPQTGDNYARLGSPAGASISADVAAVKADTAATLGAVDTEVPAILAAVDTEVAAIKAKTDLIPAGGLVSAADYTPARAAKLDNLDVAVSTRAVAGAASAVSNPVAAGGKITVFVGDDYSLLDSNSIDISYASSSYDPSAPTSITLRLYSGAYVAATVVGSVVGSASPWTFRFQPTGAETILLPPGLYRYNVKIVKGGRTRTLVRGMAEVEVG